MPLWGDGSAVLFKEVREVVGGKVTFEKSLKRSKGRSQGHIHCK